MTARKTDIVLSARLTAYVTREEGAAELRVSPSTWDEMVECGQVPRQFASVAWGQFSAGDGPTLTVNSAIMTLNPRSLFQGVRQWQGQGPQT